MDQKVLKNSLYGSFVMQSIGRGSRVKTLPNLSYYYIREPESDDTRKVLVSATQKELETILKHVPGITLKAQFQSKRFHHDMDMNDPRNLPYIYPDYDIFRWDYDLIYNPDDHDKLITVLSLWLSMENKQYNTFKLNHVGNIMMTNLCQEILL